MRKAHPGGGGSSSTDAAIVPALPVSIRRDEVLRLLGYPLGKEPAASVATALDPLLDVARALVRPRGAWRRVPVERAGDVGLAPERADALVIGLVTIGGEVERRSAELQSAGLAARALILDAAGSAAAEEAADRLGAIIVGDERSLAAPVSCRISPGYGGWELPSQRALFAVLPHEDLGISLTEGLMMVPRKSISFALWIGADARPAAGLSGCAACGLDRCRYRRPPPPLPPGEGGGEPEASRRVRGTLADQDPPRRGSL